MLYCGCRVLRLAAVALVHVLAALPLLSVARPLLLVERVTVRPALVLLRFPANIGGGLLFTLSPPCRGCPFEFSGNLRDGGRRSPGLKVVEIYPAPGGSSVKEERPRLCAAVLLLYRIGRRAAAVKEAARAVLSTFSYFQYL